MLRIFAKKTQSEKASIYWFYLGAGLMPGGCRA